MYTVVSMLYWNAERAAIAGGGYNTVNFSQRYLAKARQLDRQNPRTLYWDAWMKFNNPQHAADKKLAREMAKLSFSLIREPSDSEWPAWGKVESLELIDQY